MWVALANQKLEANSTAAFADFAKPMKGCGRVITTPAAKQAKTTTISAGRNSPGAPLVKTNEGELTRIQVVS